MKDVMSMLLMPLEGTNIHVLCLCNLFLLYTPLYATRALFQNKSLYSNSLHISVCTTGHHYTMLPPLLNFNVYSVWLLTEH